MSSIPESIKILVYFYIKYEINPLCGVDCIWCGMYLILYCM